MPTPGRIVAALSFGFWTAMFGPHYEGLWRTTLHRIAARQDGKRLRRKDFSGPLTRPSGAYVTVTATMSPLSRGIFQGSISEWSS
jgi:hypothetical protein